MIHPVLIDREMARLQKELDEIELSRVELNRKPIEGGTVDNSLDASGFTAEKKKKFIDVTNQLKVLDDRRQQILARTGDEYVIDPPKVAVKLQ